jgi:hypothetical protein
VSGFDFNRLTERVGLRVAWYPDYPSLMDGELMPATPSWWRRSRQSPLSAVLVDCYPGIVDFYGWYGPWQDLS